MIAWRDAYPKSLAGIGTILISTRRLAARPASRSAAKGAHGITATNKVVERAKAAASDRMRGMSHYALLDRQRLAKLPPPERGSGHGGFVTGALY